MTLEEIAKKVIEQIKRLEELKYVSPKTMQRVIDASAKTFRRT